MHNFSGYAVVYDVHLNASNKAVGKLTNDGVLEIPVEVGTHTLSFNPSVTDWDCGSVDVVIKKSHEVVKLSMVLEPPKGFKIENGAVSAQRAQGYQQGTTSQSTAPKSKIKLIDQNERIIATLGTTYRKNILIRSRMAESSAVLTDERLYYTGTSFVGTDLTTGEYVVSIRDISMTNFVIRDKLLLALFGFFFIILGAILFPWGLSDASLNMLNGVFSALIGLFFLLIYFCSKRNVFEVYFHGGKFQFDANENSFADIQNFQRQIHLQKDRYYDAETQ